MLITIITKNNEEVCRVRHDGRDVLCISGHEKEKFDMLFAKHNESRYAWEILLHSVRDVTSYDIETIC